MVFFFLSALVWLISGYALGRYFFRQTTALALLPTVLGLGFILQGLALNALTQLLPVPMSYGLSLALLLALGAGAWRFCPSPPPLQLGLSRRGMGAGLIFIGLLWLGIASALFRFEYFDRNWHLPLAGVLGAEGLPARYVLNPQACLSYHFGMNLTAGALGRMADGQIRLALDFSAAWMVLALLSAVFALGGRYGKAWGGALAVLFFLCGGSLTWALVLGAQHGLAVERVAWAAPLLPLYETASRAPLSGLAVPNEPAFPPFNLWLHTTSIIGGFWLFWWLFLQVEATPARAPHQASRWLSLGVLTGALELYSEPLWALLAGVLGLYALWQMREERGRVLRYAGLAMLGMGLTVLGQGGVLSTGLTCQNAEAQSVTGVRWAGSLGYYSWLDGERLALTSPAAAGRAALEWGLWPFLALGAAYSFRRQAAPACLFVGVAVLGISAALLDFEVGVNSTRLFVLLALVSAPMSALALMSLGRARPLLRPVLVLVGLAFLLNGLLWYEAQTFAGGGRVRLHPLDQQLARAWYARLPADSLVIDPTGRERVGELLGAYTLTDRPVGWDSLDLAENERLLVFAPYLRRYPDPAYLRFLGADYLLLDEAGRAGLSAEGQAILDESRAYRLLFSAEADGAGRWLYQVVLATPASYPAFYAHLATDPAIVAGATLRHDWAERLPAEARVLMPRDNLGLAGLLTAENLVYREQAEGQDAPAINAWAEEKRAAPLYAAGYTHLLADSIWLGALQPFEAAHLNDPAQYEVVGRWGADGVGYILYRLLP